MEFFNKNKNTIFGLTAAVVAVFGIGYWTHSPSESQEDNTTEVATDKLNHEVIEEIVVVAEKPGFAEKVNEAAVANQVNAAQKLSEDSDGVPEE